MASKEYNRALQHYRESAVRELGKFARVAREAGMIDQQGYEALTDALNILKDLAGQHSLYDWTEEGKS